ncbi:MAG: cytochrome c [Planctomycetaceae bacterium]|nr:cytochrome c [Planctomycetaceae bacterium]
MKSIDASHIRLVSAFGMTIAVLFLAGCGGSTSSEGPAASPGVAQTDGAPATQPGQKPAAAAAASAGPQRRQNERWTDANGVEYLGDVPLDVFFDRPLEVAANATVLQGAPAAAPAMMAASTPAAPTEAPEETAEPAAGAVAWDELISVEDLTGEVKDARNFLNRSLQRYGDFKKANLMIPGKAASIAVFASVAMQHPGEVSWKEDAAYIRDLAKKINEDTIRPDKKTHEKVLLLFENIASTLDRSRPADLEEPPADDTLADVASMDLVMVRLDEAEKRLKTEAGSQSAFDSKKEMIRREASVLGAMSHAITMESYGYNDDEEFTGYANQIVTAAQNIKNALDASDFDSYELALSKVSTSCTDCHSAYRNN